MTVLKIVSTNEKSPTDEASRERSDIDFLHAISLDLIVEQDVEILYEKIVDAAIAITKSQFGTMQLFRLADDGLESGLQLLISRGLSHQDRAVWEWVSPKAYSSCTLALKTSRRTIIPDYESWEDIAGTEDLLAFRRAGIRAAQTTPLFSRSGALLGMISTHWSEPHEPSERDLRMLDILARQAADLLERTIAEKALREREKELENKVSELRAAQDLQKLLANELGHRVKNLFAMVSAVVSQTLRGSSEHLRTQTLQQRLIALSSAHDILLQSNWQSSQLADVATAAINGTGVSGRVRIDGPSVFLGSKAALSLALVLHELTTNALKYGSLSVGGGYVDFTWRLDTSVDGDLLRLLWRETKGPEVIQPSTKGFGSKLISAGLNGLGGVIVVYDKAGLFCEMSASVSQLQGAE
ncbi:GAF domain-containing protein [Agrobacterium larrymoorei]|uniref:sensor histidine kinase n=1 Tax=Agrobacterium larrymoorei TaxID=160699 RepID=UPI0015734825|nr:HWE histidine kinase domain-containing protein [Agrobacterium larrymoorei]NTJ43689.1 GAF domain-containing protein [Agrobacterium larrymoorei]